MTVVGWICVAISMGIGVLSAGAVIWQRHRYKAMMNRLMDKLDAAADGTFIQMDYDETLVSAVESKLDGYLSASTVSSRNIVNEKEKIKQLLADISHQTKTPIANILLYAQLLAEQDLSEESRRCAEALCTQAEKMNFLVSALVKLSRLETGILTLYPKKNRIRTMLDEIEKQFAPKAEESGVQLLFEPSGEECIFDPKWTVEAISNLVDNAIKYTAAGGVVHVSVTAYEFFCRIDVRDSGAGIPEDEQAKVFTRFYRSPSVSQQEGVGIGLYLARQILTEQGGYIKVTSAPGGGSIFSAFLPRSS